MEAKKKLKFSSRNYGVVLKVLILFMLVLGLQMIFSSTCLASISREYVDFTLNCAYNDSNLSLNATQLSWLNGFKNRNSSVTEFISFLNYYANTYNMPTNDYNIICFPYKPGTSGFYLYYFFSNCSFAPSNIGFLNLTSYNATTLRPSNLNGSCLVVSLYFTDSYPSVNSTTSLSSYYLSNPGGYTYNTELTVLNLTSCYNYMPTQSIYFTPLSRYMLLNNGSFTYTNTLQPDEPSGDSSGDISGESTTGVITNPSGEITGNIDLSGIENGIGQINENLENIENKIPSSGDIANVVSGEVGKITDVLTTEPNISDTVITSGDIESALNLEFESDPYANFWLELTNGLKNALLGSKRSIDISFQGRTWTINLDDFAVLPPWLKIILTPFSTVFFVWILVRWWKVILDKISSGNVDSILKDNAEERYFKFVLGGAKCLKLYLILF